jgi:hypothetical protein
LTWGYYPDPTSSLCLLHRASPAFTNDTDGVVITWQNVTNVTYYLQRSSDLSGSFSVIQSNLIGQARFTRYTDTSAKNGGPCFYRVGVQSPHAKDAKVAMAGGTSIPLCDLRVLCVRRSPKYHLTPPKIQRRDWFVVNGKSKRFWRRSNLGSSPISCAVAALVHNILWFSLYMNRQLWLPNSN